MVRPLPLAAPALPPAGLLPRARSFLRQTWRGRILLGALFVLALDLLLGLAGYSLGALDGLAWIILVLYGLWGLWRALGWLSRTLLWRIRTKLLVSYFFIGLVPVVLLTLFFMTAGVLLMVLSASRLVTGEIDRVAGLVRSTAAAALVDLPAGDAAAAASLQDRLAAVRALHPEAAFTLLRGGRVAAANGEAPRALPAWWKGPDFASLVRLPSKEERVPGVVVLRVASSRDEAALIIDVPADSRFFADLEGRAGIHVVQPKEFEIVTGPSPRPHVRLRAEKGSAVEYEEAGQRLRLRSGAGLAFVALPSRTDWESGQPPKDDFMPVVFRFEPLEFVRRLSPDMRGLGEWRSLSDVLLFALGVVGLVFLVMYGVALFLGVLLARSITRGVHALSVGTQRLRQGDFSHTIRIRSRDQIGELAESFNLMARGIQELMEEQVEKERLEEELRIARRIQMSLLPGDEVVTMAGVRVAALCLPAAEVGGDYYDLLPLSPTRMGVLVADVSGKGTSAALYMAELKGLVLSLSRIYDSPARLLSEANRILAANMDARSFVTMTYAVVDTAARRMRFARAGHSPILHLEARTGRTHVLAPPGLGLGLDGGERFERVLEEDERPLEPGDFFLFFTDGLSEAMNTRAELFGEGRLRTILEEGASLGSEDLKDRILEEVQRFVGEAAPHDDMTLVVLKVVPQGAGA